MKDKENIQQMVKETTIIKFNERMKRNKELTNLA